MCSSDCGKVADFFSNNLRASCHTGAFSALDNSNRLGSNALLKASDASRGYLAGFFRSEKIAHLEVEERGGGQS